MSPPVLTEVDHLAKARFGSGARPALIDFIVFQARRGRFRVPEITIELLETARQVQRRYAGLGPDRRDFRAIRPLTPHPAFRLLPDDT